ncbi:MAG TPA: hypothetical protein VG347_03530 [Verrucomicrobiae bacterium]|nr:hypothetical protein [Verrucomicrobiae bacterium]
MSDAIRIEIEIPEDTRRAIAACKNKRGLARALARTMDRQNELTVRGIRAKLTGPVLKVQTGTLRRSIGRTNALVLDDRVESTVGSGPAFGASSVAYAAFWEFGYHGTETIGAHVRRLRNGGTANVKEHARKVNQDARSFIGSTIADREPEYGTALMGVTSKFFGGAA